MAKIFVVAGVVIVGFVGAGAYSVWHAAKQLSTVAQTVERARVFHRAPASSTSPDAAEATLAAPTTQVGLNEEPGSTETPESVAEPFLGDETVDVSSLNSLAADPDPELRNEARALMELASSEEFSADVILDEPETQ